MGVFLLFGCSTEEEPGDVIFSKFERIKDVLVKDTWKVEEFLINEAPLNEDIGDYIFRFNTNQTLSIERDSIRITGNWRYESFPYKGELLKIETPPDSDLYIFSESWEIEAVINRQIKLSVRTDTLSKRLVFERL